MYFLVRDTLYFYVVRQIRRRQAGNSDSRRMISEHAARGPGRDGPTGGGWLIRRFLAQREKQLLGRGKAIEPDPWLAYRRPD